MSEPLINNDSDADLEKELAELLNENNTNNSATFAESNLEIEKLEQRLNDLRMDGKYHGIYSILYEIIWCMYNILVSLDENTIVPPSVSSHKKKKLQEPEYSVQL